MAAVMAASVGVGLGKDGFAGHPGHHAPAYVSERRNAQRNRLRADRSRFASKKRRYVDEKRHSSFETIRYL
jgi:hypothetical protein